MLQFLETGRALYLLAAICLMGVISRLAPRRAYRRLMKETDNMTLTRNRFLRDLKQKAENTYRLNQGVRNTRAYLEKQLYHCRFLGISLSGWGNLSGQLTVLCFLAGAAAAFGSYWYRCDNYYIVLYSSVGMMTGLFTMMVDYGVNLGERRQQLLAALQDYLENSLFQRLEKDIAPVVDMELEQKELLRGRNREKRAAQTAQVTQNGQDETAKRTARTRQEKRLEAQEEMEKSAMKEAALGDLAEGTQQDTGVAAASASSGTQSRKDIDYLKQSLEQIAASREKNRQERDWVKNLSKDELQLVGDILREYLA